MAGAKQVRAIAVVAVASVGSFSSALPAMAAAKDESAAEWLPLPKEFDDWRNMLSDRGLAFGATYIADNIANVSGGIKRGAIHFGRLDLGVDADALDGTRMHARIDAQLGLLRR